MRQQLKARLRTEHITTAENLYLDNQYKALERLTENVHLKAFPRTRESYALGVNPEQCKILISKTVLDFQEKQRTEGVFGRLKSKLRPQNDADGKE